MIGALENQGGIVGQIAAPPARRSAWSLVTFLAVPVIAIEGTGPIETLKRSASSSDARWGQQVTGNIAIGGAVFLLRRACRAALLIVAGVVIWASASFAGALLVVIGVIGLAIAMLITQRAERHLRRRPLPLRARRRGGRRLHRRGARVGGRSQEGRPQRAADGDARHRLQHVSI